MNFLNVFILFLSYIECYIIEDNVTYLEVNNNDTYIYRLTEYYDSFGNSEEVGVRIVIFAVTIILLILTSFLLCTLCCKQYRRRENAFFGRSPSVTSIQELIRERLQDRPPTYHESQTSINTAHLDDPPSYQDVAVSAVTSEIQSSVYTISVKASTVSDNNDPHCLNSECESDTDSSPPSYQVSEGVINPVFLQTIPAFDAATSSNDNLPLPSNELHI